MKLSPREIESLLLHQVGSVAQKRLARGVKLNHPEAVALIGSQIQEFIRDGKKDLSEIMNLGRNLLGIKQVLPGVAEMIHEVQVEGTFPDGTKLVTIHDPIGQEHGDLVNALYGSFLPVPDKSLFDDNDSDKKDGKVDAPLDVKPGEYVEGSKDPMKLNEGRRYVTIKVTSTCDRPIQIGSHYHFIEANKHLVFDREAAYGMRLNIPAGTAIRFSPGETRDVNLVSIGGKRVIHGGNFLANGPVSKFSDKILSRIDAGGFGHKPQEGLSWTENIYKMPRQIYIRTFGPTVGDKVRLGDTSLFIEVEKDFTVYGDECKFGGGKVLREGMGQAALVTNDTALDTVITNALILDAELGVVKADIGIKGGIIIGIGKAGNPDVMDGVTGGMICGVGTEAIAGEGLIITAGGLDAHVHFICPQLAREAIASGLTTMFGGGTGPATGTNATTCTPGPNHIKNMIQSTDAFPLNFGFTGKGNTAHTNDGSNVRELEEQIEAGAIGLKLHEDWGSTPAGIDTALRVGDKMDVQITIHTDTLNESCNVEQSIEAFKGRTIHTYHSEGAGGGHAPDIMTVVGVPNVLPSSTNPTRPYTKNTIDEHLDMLIVCHHLDKNLKEDVAFADSRIRAETIAAEDILHDMGAISIIASDSQAMGRVGEVITRTWQTADKMRLLRGRLAEEKGDNDNLRARRYVAKYTINPAIAHGMSHMIGSIKVGKLADLVLWNPAFFGAKPEIIVKGGQIAWSQMGMPNASIPTPEPVRTRKMFGAYGKAVGETSVIFVSQAAGSGIKEKYGINKKAVPVKNCRSLSKRDMVLNDYLPEITVNAENYEVHITKDDGKPEMLTCEPANRLALAQRYFLF